MMRVSGHALIAVESLFFQVLETFVFHLLHEGVGVSLFFLDLFLFHGTGSKGVAPERFWLVLMLFVTMFAPIGSRPGGSRHARFVLCGIQQDTSGGVD